MFLKLYFLEIFRNKKNNDEAGGNFLCLLFYWNPFIPVIWMKFTVCEHHFLPDLIFSNQKFFKIII